MPVEALGWISSWLLVVTMFLQVRKQWAQGSSQGISKYLYLGQVLAEVGFVAYSVIVRNWVFVFTNTVLLVLNLIGLALLVRHRGWRRVFLSPAMGG